MRNSFESQEKRVPEAMKRKGVPDPKPLRSHEFPEGLPGLTGADLQGVLAANAIYESKDVWRFNTEEEAEYPDLLCQRAADAIKSFAESSGILVQEDQARLRASAG